jgi:hypothetical protein
MAQPCIRPSKPSKASREFKRPKKTEFIRMMKTLIGRMWGLTQKERCNNKSGTIQSAECKKGIAT